MSFKKIENGLPGAQEPFVRSQYIEDQALAWGNNKNTFLAI
jgi:hypothetical protein